MTEKGLVARIVRLAGKVECEAYGSLICFYEDPVPENDNPYDEYPDYTDEEITKQLKAMGYL